MCLILFAHRSHPDLPLIVAANRDEFYDRPTRQAEFWPESPGILAGRDLQAGGTWLGITRKGRFAAITNIRGATGSGGHLRSRGELTRDFLQGDSSPTDYAKAVLARSSQYNGFNLLVGDSNELVYCENVNNTFRSIPPGIYGLSNHLLDTPWPKVVTGKHQLTTLLGQWHSAACADSNGLLDLLTDADTAEDDLLPDTGVGLTLERQLSPIFIRGEIYGTCCSTVLVIDGEGQAKFHERSFYGAAPQDAVYRFEMDYGGG